MLSLPDILQQDWIYSLAWALVHSLWQFALIAIFCASLLWVTKTFPSAIRYWLSLGCLAVGTLTSVITFYRYQRDQSTIVMHAGSTNEITFLFKNHDTFSIEQFIDNHINELIMIWFCGLFLLTLKLLLNYRHCWQLKNQQLLPTPQQWLINFAMLVKQTGAPQRTELRVSAIAKTPCAIGHLKPVVLLPASILLHMSQTQIEMILLHELAHVRRQDFVIGLLQAALKALFFFNPFLYWISHQIDKEREYACDDIALALNPNPMLFANTLKEFAQMNINQSNSMHITGKKVLLERITRLFKPQKKVEPLKVNVLTSIFILVSGLLVTICVNADPDKLNNKKISIDVANVSAQEVLNEINQRCGTTTSLTIGMNEKMTLVLEDISCKDAIQLVKDFADGSAAGNETVN